MKVYRYVLGQMFCSKKFIVYIVSASILSLTSILLLREITEEYSGALMSMLEVYRVGDHYDLWILSLRSLNVLKGFYDDEILMGVLSGSFLQMLAVLLITMFVCDAYNSGYLKYALMKGVRRRILFNSYLISGVLGIIPIALVYETGVIIALILDGRMHLMNPAKVMLTVLVQFVLLISFCVVIAVLIMLIGNVYGIVMCIGLVLVLPTMPNYIMLYSDGRINIAPIMITSLIQKVYSFSIGMNIWAVFVAFVTAALAYICGLIIFENLNFK